jgi:hypothetical protein
MYVENLLPTANICDPLNLVVSIATQTFRTMARHESEITLCHLHWSSHELSTNC